MPPTNLILSFDLLSSGFLDVALFSGEGESLPDSLLYLYVNSLEALSLFIESLNKEFVF